MLVFEELLAQYPHEKNVQIHEGGLAGLNLLPLLEKGGRVVFIDAVSGYGEPGEIVLLSHQEIVNSFTTTHYSHDTGLPYLLTVLPNVCDGQEPEEIVLVGLEGLCSPERIEQAARLSMSLALHGTGDLR